MNKLEQKEIDGYIRERNITQAMTRIKLKLRSKVTLSDLSIICDWVFKIGKYKEGVESALSI